MLMLHEGLAEAHNNTWKQFGIVVAAALCVPLLDLCETYGVRTCSIARSTVLVDEILIMCDLCCACYGI